MIKKQIENELERLEELDKVFDILLILLTVITGTLFDYDCTIEPIQIASLNQSLSETEFLEEVNKNVTMALRAFFIPLIFLIIA